MGWKTTSCDADATAYIEQLQITAQQYADARSEMQKKAGALRDELETRRSEYVKERSKWESWHTEKIDAFTAEISAIKSAMEMALQDRDVLSKSLISSRSSGEAQAIRISIMEKELSNAESTITHLGAVDKAVDETKCEISSLLKIKVAYEKKIAKLGDHLEEAKQTICEKESDIDNLQSEMIDVNRRLALRDADPGLNGGVSGLRTHSGARTETAPAKDSGASNPLQRVRSNQDEAQRILEEIEKTSDDESSEEKNFVSPDQSGINQTGTIISPVGLISVAPPI
jgi:chromosome segregation ATPase